MIFPGGIESTSNGTLLLSAAAAVVYGMIVEMRPMPLRTAVKALAVALLGVLTFVENGPPLLLCALLLGACGDALLSCEGDRAFLAGLASFLASHLCYIALFASEGAGLGPVAAEAWRAALAVAMAAAALAMLAVLWRRVAPALRLPIVLYCIAILGMGWASLTLATPWVSIGAVLFMASDALLAAERYVVSAVAPRRGRLRLGVWALYYLAQLMITLSFLVSA